jgi:hypothetical protein
VAGGLRKGLPGCLHRGSVGIWVIAKGLADFPLSQKNGIFFVSGPRPV